MQRAIGQRQVLQGHVEEIARRFEKRDDLQGWLREAAEEDALEAHHLALPQLVDEALEHRRGELCVLGDIAAKLLRLPHRP